MSVESGQATWTLAAMVALGEADTAALGAYAGVPHDVVASVLRVDADLVDETIATDGAGSPDGSRRTTWRLRSRDKLRARMGQMSGRGAEAARPDGGDVMPSDVAVAEQTCTRAYAITSRTTRGVLARTALHLVGPLQPHVHVGNWRARLAMLASPAAPAPGRPGGAA